MNDFLQSLEDPHARHAMLVHLPIVVGMLGFLPVAALLLTRMRSKALIWVCVMMFALASASGWLAVNAGEEAEHRAEEAPMSAAAKETLERHEELGELGWLWPLIPMAALVVSMAVKPDRWKLALGGAALAGSLGVGGWVALTAHEGGELVYVHGVGVPGAATPSVSPAAPSKSGDDDVNDHDEAEHGEPNR